MALSTQFWHVDGPDDNRKCAEWADDEMDLESILCPAYSGHQRAGKRLMNLSVRLPARRVEDFVWTWYSECLIQDKVLNFFREQRFTGFEVKPVKARFKNKSAESPPKLWELVVTGWGGMAPPESGIELTYRCDACGHTRYSGLLHPEKLIDESRWDGSDFFIVWPLPKFVFVTCRVAEAIRGQRFTGAQFVVQADLKLESTDEYSPGPLSYYMPEERAREIGEPLGIY